MKGLAASPSELAEHNSLKQEMIVARKAKCLNDLSDRLGRPVRAVTMTCSSYFELRPEEYERARTKLQAASSHSAG